MTYKQWLVPLTDKSSPSPCPDDLWRSTIMMHLFPQSLLTWNLTHWQAYAANSYTELRFVGNFWLQWTDILLIKYFWCLVMTDPQTCFLRVSYIRKRQKRKGDNKYNTFQRSKIWQTVPKHSKSFFVLTIVSTYVILEMNLKNPGPMM